MWLIAQMPTGGHHDGLFMGLHWFWWLFWIFVAFAVVWVFWRLVHSERRLDGEESRSGTAEEILRRRLSEGDIDEDEFRRRLRALQESTESGGGPASGED